jgi:hypothetical protein
MDDAKLQSWTPYELGSDIDPSHWGRPIEGLVKRLENHSRIGYVRFTHMTSPREISMYLRTNNEGVFDSKPDSLSFICNTVMGGISISADKDLQSMAVKRIADFLHDLAIAARRLEGLVPHFYEINTNAPYFDTEIANLEKLQKAGERFKNGQFQQSDLELFWGYGTEWDPQK